MTYIAETYENFGDNLADFKWGIDTNGDESFDLIVFAEWDQTELVAGVDDAAENPVAEATVSRPAPDSIQVVFPVSVLGGATAYRYGVSAQDDLNGNGETDPGEQDLAPDAGLYDHSLSSAPAAQTPTRGGTVPVAGPAPMSAPAPAPAAKPVPAPAPVAVPDTPRTPAAAPPAVPAPAPTPAAAPAPAGPAAPKPAAGSMTQEITAPEAVPDAVPVEAVPTTLARTGATHVLLALVAGLALVAAGFLFFAETLVPTSRQRA